jgi:U3 small nucleolar RNA-associated protein 12
MQARAAGSTPGPFPPNPLLLGMAPGAFVLRAVSGVRSADLEHALLLLPFASALQLLDYLPLWLANGTSGELACNVATLLLRLHQRQLAGTGGARGVMLRLRSQLRPRLQELKDVMGFNLAATGALKRVLAEQRGAAAML